LCDMLQQVDNHVRQDLARAESIDNQNTRHEAMIRDLQVEARRQEPEDRPRPRHASEVASARQDQPFVPPVVTDLADWKSVTGILISG